MTNSSAVNIIINNDKSLRLETDSLFKKLINIFFIPIINNLPRGFKKYIKKSNEATAKVIENVTNHDALEILYSKGNIVSKNKKNSLITKMFQNIWFNLDNPKAVRNRLKLVIKEMHLYLENIARNNKGINVISIASGSSRAIIEVIQKSNCLKDTKLSVTFLDKNPKAVEYSKNLCKDISGFDLNWINDTVGNFFRNGTNKKFNIVEIVGLFDYFSDEKVEETLRGIYNILLEGGIVITANINHNREEKFMTNIIGWSMVYRPVENLVLLAEKAGFSRNKMKVFYEPLKIHGIVVAKK